MCGGRKKEGRNLSYVDNHSLYPMNHGILRPHTYTYTRTTFMIFTRPLHTLTYSHSTPSCTPTPHPHTRSLAESGTLYVRTEPHRQTCTTVLSRPRCSRYQSVSAALAERGVCSSCLGVNKVKSLLPIYQIKELQGTNHTIFSCRMSRPQ